MAGITGPLRFECDFAGDRNASRLCLNGGTCSTAAASNGDSWDVCVCPSGFSADYTLGHFPNCSLPSAALPVMFGVLTVCYMLSFMFCVPEYWHLKSQVKQLMLINLIQGVLNWAVFLSVFAENGFFEAAAILSFLSNSLIFVTMTQTTLMTSIPIYGMFKQSVTNMKRAFYAITTVTILVELAVTICMIIFARDANPAKFNKVMVVYQFFNNGAMIVLGSINCASVIRLRQNLVKSHGASSREDIQMEALIARLNKMIQAAIWTTSLFGVLLIYPIVWMVLKSFPGQYILFFIMYSSTPFYMVQSVISFRTESTERLQEIKDGKHTSRKGKKDDTEHSKSKTTSKNIQSSEVQLATSIYRAESSTAM